MMRRRMHDQHGKPCMLALFILLICLSLSSFACSQETGSWGHHLVNEDVKRNSKGIRAEVAAELAAELERLRQLIAEQRAIVDSQLATLAQALDRWRNNDDKARIFPERTASGADSDGPGSCQLSSAGQMAPGECATPWGKESSEGSGRRLDEARVGGESAGGVVSFGLGSGRVVSRPEVRWGDHFKLLSAVAVNTDTSCLHLLPQVGEEGLSRYIVVGGENGGIHVFRPRGEMVASLRGLSHAPVTAMLSFAISREESHLFTGHADGSVLVYKAIESGDWSTPFDDTAFTLSVEPSRPLIPPSHASPHSSQPTSPVPPPAHKTSSPKPQHSEDSPTETPGSAESQLSHPLVDKPDEPQPYSSPITALSIYSLGIDSWRMVVVDESARVRLFAEDYSLKGSLQALNRPLAFLPSTAPERAMFITESGVGSVDVSNLQLRTGPCAGLNDSRITEATFDVTGRSKAFALTEDSNTLTLHLAGETTEFECRVKTRRTLQPPLVRPRFMQAIQDYVLVSTQEGVRVFNTTVFTRLGKGGIVSGPRPLFSVPTEDILSSFSSSPPASNNDWPTLVTTRGGLVVLSLPGGLVGIFKSNLPVHRVADFNSQLWSSPIFITLLIVVGVWQFSKQRSQYSGSASMAAFRAGLNNGRDVGLSRIPGEDGTKDVSQTFKAKPKSRYDEGQDMGLEYAGDMGYSKSEAKFSQFPLDKGWRGGSGSSQDRPYVNY